jgi:nucleotide-binding universal stress UspA family protein
MNPEYDVNRLYLSELAKQATGRLTELKTRATDQGLSVQTQTATGIPSEEVLAAAKSEDAELIVVGTKGKTGLQHVLLGSTAERIIRVAPCPVLVVPRNEEEHVWWPRRANQHGGPNRILVPIDFSDCSIEALEYAALVAQRTKASLLLLHVLEPVSYGLDFTLPHVATREQTKHVITERLSGLAAALTAAHVKSEYLIHGGIPSDSILEVARTEQVNLIVMGTHGRRGLAHAFCGSVAEFILRKSPYPVLTVRSPKFHPGHRRIFSAKPAISINS